MCPTATNQASPQKKEIRRFTFAGFLATVDRSSATNFRSVPAFVSYLFDRSHSWYAALLKIFVPRTGGLDSNQGNGTPQVIRHDRRAMLLHAELRWFVFTLNMVTRRNRVIPAVRLWRLR